MKRHMDLIRDILIFAEQQEESWFARSIEIKGSGHNDIVYNTGLAIDAGFLDGKDASTSGPDGKDFLVLGMTYYGHEYLDHIRSDAVWNRLKTMARDKGIDLSVDLVKQLAPKVVAGILGIT